MGSGTPAVIFESGLGGTSFEWTVVQRDVASRYQACSYDRAGLGYSDPSPRDRTSRAMADELAALLDAATITQPVILVAQSFGGFTARIVASEFPDRVNGLVLVDTSHEDQARRFAAAGIRDSQLPPVALHVVPILARLGITRALGVAPGINTALLEPSARRFAAATAFHAAAFRETADEYLAVGESAAQVHASRRTLGVPLIVLSRTRERDALSGRVWQEMQADQVTISTRSCRTAVANAGHLIQIDQPGAIAAAIDEVAAAAKESRAPVCASVAGEPRKLS